MVAEHISERIAKQIVDASLDDPVEELSLLPLLYKKLTSYSREYVAKVEGELQKIRDGILALMDKELIPTAWH